MAMSDSEKQPTSSELDVGVLVPLSDPVKAAISKSFWGHDPALLQTTQRLHSSGSKSRINLDPYFAYYTKQCRHALHDGGRHVATRTHADIVSCADMLKTNMTRREIRDAIAVRSKLGSKSPRHPNASEMIDSSIDLSASLLLMTNFGSCSYGFSGKARLSWESESEPEPEPRPQHALAPPPPHQSSLRDFLEAYFAPDPPSHASSLSSSTVTETVKLEKIFKASNLCRIAGLRIVWTDNLADHLRLSDDDTRVHIFHHASFLQAQSPDTQACLFPVGLVEETLKTLALLFPSSDAETKAWLDGLPALGSTTGADGEEGEIDKRVTHCGRLKTDDRRIDRFRYWRDRLIMLKQVFDEAQPKTIQQWWYDSRNGVQWYTFWVAVLVLVLTIVFGLIQSIEGALQVYASFREAPQSGNGDKG
ncbi:hypothetical protein QBC42DRAFT_270086 [Cladorrhinum samala]|uniref:Uncharacterized protein n=1 Tax=Cladorrhinum samala TaxID=585594 RepID=A0AAV9HLB5_9PEZI|nr:hypothetical protein QBC42DRAFT_270086 [Cladorrhinum samala]